MSQQPKRTVEMGEGAQSQSKPTRPSRIAQPIRRPSTRERSLERASSLDRLTLGPYLPGSAMKTRKASTYATPMRTPMRTPGRAVQRPELLLTSEKEKLPSDKKWIQTQAAKITEYLQSVGVELGGDFARVGLKGMTTKQFLVILSHFFKFTVSNRMSIRDNYVDNVAKILTQIGYPYPVNKSWLKTPTAPHAFNNVVVLLHWLMQFVPRQNCFAELSEYIDPGTDFPDKGFAQLFMRRTEEGFILWNNSKDEELQALKQNLVDEIILGRTGIAGTEAIERETAVLNYELDKLFQNRVVIKREEEFLKMDKEVKCKDKFVLKMEESCVCNAKKLKELAELAERKSKEVANIHQRIAAIKETIRTQEVSLGGREELVSKISNLRQCLDSKKTLINQLQEMGADNQVLLSRLMKQKIDVIARFNNYLYQIFSEPRESCSIDVKDFLLDQNSEDLEQELKRVVPLLEETSKKNLEEYVKYSSEIGEIESQLKLATYTHDTVLEQTLSEVKQKCSDLEKNIEKLNMRMIKEKWCGGKQLEALTTCFQELSQLNNEIKESIAADEKRLSQMQGENKAMLARLGEKGREFIGEKSKVTDRLCEAIDSFRNTMQNITLKLKDSI